METIKVTCRAADLLPIDALTEFQGELKKITKANISKLKKSILKHGFTAPIFVWKEYDNYILDGHQRLKALCELRRDGYDIPLLPVAYIEAESEEDAKRKLLHITSQYGEFSLDGLQEFTEGMEFDFDSIRLTDGEFNTSSFMEEENTLGDDEIPEEQEESVSKLGEVYDLGSHRLMCGDSTDPEQVERLMDGDVADVWVTDPPYNVNYEGKTKKSLKIQNDKMDDTGFRQFLRFAFKAAVSVMKPGAAYYIWHADSEGYNFRGACQDAGLKVRQCLIWNKQTMVMGRQDYHWKHEPCLYGWKDGASHLWASDRKQTTVLNFDRPSRSADHPTMKPVDLFAYCILNNTKGEDIVLDTFAGSGTALISAAKTGRIARVMELDPNYCDVIRRRWTRWARENGHDEGSGSLEPVE